MDALEVKEISGLRAELDARATTQYVDGSDRALQLQIDQVEGDLNDAENELVEQDNRLSQVEAALPGKAPKQHTHTASSISDLHTAATMLSGTQPGFPVSGTWEMVPGSGMLFNFSGGQYFWGILEDAALALVGPGGQVAFLPNGAVQLYDNAGYGVTLKAGPGGVLLANGQPVGAEGPLLAAELLPEKQAEWAGLSFRAAVLKLINSGVTTPSTDPPTPATGNSYVEDDYVEDGYVE